MPSHPPLAAAFDHLDLPEAVRAMVIARHGEPHRHYHTLRHLDLMLRQLPPDHPSLPEMIVATLFHDIVYDPTRADNEECSLALFESVAAQLAPMANALVATMILATKSHHFRPPDTAQDVAVNTLLKADLAILWHPDPAVYAWYAAGVRQEYGFVPADRFRTARASILTGLRDDLLASGQLTPAEATALERNIGWELG